MTPATAAEFGGNARFEIVRRIGSGGMGVVYEAFDRERDQVVALKALRSPDAELIYRLKNEFRALADLSHPNLITLHELFLDGDRCFFTMELIRGLELQAHLRPEAASDATLPPNLLGCDEARLRDALPQLAKGLAALHQAGRIHRDIKPSNILVTSEGRLVLVDFGLVVQAQTLDPDTQSGRPVGTIAYMAPEQAHGDAKLTPAVDWYAVGAIIYEALTGRVPFSGPMLEVLLEKQRTDPPSPRALVPATPADLDELCMALLARDPAHRPDARGVFARLGIDRKGAAIPDSGHTLLGAPFAGREAELTELRAGLAALDQGRPAVMLLQGPSGLGKSALVSAFLDRARREDGRLAVLEGRCYEREDVAYKAMDSLVDRLSHLWVTLPPAEASLLAPREASLLPRLFPVLGRVPVVAEAPPARALGDPQEMRTRAFAALREVLQRLGDRRRLVLVLDDLQWVDANTLLLLSDILRPPHSPLVFLILSTRPEGAAALQPLMAALDGWKAQRELRPFTAGESRQLAEQYLHGRHPELAFEISRDSGGNPFYIAELAQYVQTHEVRDLANVRLEDLLAARVAQLPEAARRFLAVVALAGEPVSRRSAGTAAGIEAKELVGITGVLRTLRLARATGSRAEDRVEPFHDRIRDAVIASLSPQERRAHHRALALAYEQWGEASAERMARHWQGAGEHTRAAEHARRAAEEAFAAVDFDRAADLLRVAIELGKPEGEEARQQRQAFGEALANAGRPREAAEQFLLAAELAEPGLRLDLRRRSAEALFRGGYVDEGLAALRAVLGEIGMSLAPSPRVALVSVLLRRAWLRLRGLRWRRRDPSEVPQQALLRVDILWSVAASLGVVDSIRGLDYQTRNLLMALRVGEVHRVVRAVVLEACFLAAQGASRRARDVAGLAQGLASSTGDPFGLALAAWADAFVDYFADSAWRASLRRFQESETLFKGHYQSGGWELDTVQLYGCFNRLYLGELGELGDLVTTYVREAERRGDRYMAVNLRTRLPIVWLMRDDVEGARRDVADAIASWVPADHSFQVQHFWNLYSSCELALYAGAPTAAVTALARDRAALRGSLLLRLPIVRVEMSHLRARLALAEGARATGSARTRHAANALREARQLRGERLPIARAWAPLVEAGVANLEGDPERATRLLERATDALGRLEAGLYERAARQRLGRMLGGSRGETLIGESRVWFDGQGVKNPARMCAMLVPGWPDE